MHFKQYFRRILQSKFEGHRSLMITVARLESGICKIPRFAPESVHLVFCVLSASEIWLLLVVKLGRNVVMMRASVKIMHQVMRDVRQTTE